MIYPEGKNIAILDDGTIVPVGSRMSASEIVTQLKDVMALPYEGTNPRLRGKTLLEAAFIEAATKAANGDVEVLDKILNRLIGKPLQTVVSATGSLKDFLDQVAAAEPIDVQEVDPLGE